MAKRTTAKKRILLLLFGIVMIGVVLFGLFYHLLKQDHNRISPVNGSLDLQSWNPRREGMISLSGRWDFYWRQLLTGQELSDDQPLPDLIVDVPEVWNNYQLRGENLPGFGYATYRLQVVNIPPGMPLALRIGTCSTAYQLYLNGRLASANGQVAIHQAEFRPEYQPRVVEFISEDSSLEILVQVANFIYARGGMWDPIYLGTPEQIRKLDLNIEDKDLFLIGALTMMALYYLSTYMLRREDKSSLYFVLMCLTFVCRTAVLGDYFIYRLFPAISFSVLIAIEYLSMCWFPIFGALLVGELFGEETHKPVLRAALVYGAVMAALFCFTPLAFYTGQVHLVQIGALAIGLYAIGCLLAALGHRKQDALLVLVGAVALMICAGHDVLYHNNLILSDYGELVQVGLFILLFMQSFVLARRFAEAFHHVKALSQKLLQLDQIKDEFLANTSHELRTPINGIRGLAEAMLRGGEGPLNSGQKRNLSVITGSCRRLANLVNDILDYSKLKHGDIRLNQQPVRLDGLIQTVVKVFQQLSKAKGFAFLCELPASLPPVLIDENRVVQILYNLIGNAVKFTTQGYIKVAARVTGEMVEVSVSDTGAGIPESQFQEIFKSFEQIDTSLTRKHGGTGLGLSITKQLLELQGGKIWVESALGVGSTFYFTVPIAMEFSVGQAKGLDLILPELAVSALEEPVASRESSAGVRLLLVDDDDVCLRSTAALLKVGGYAVTPVNSGKNALEELSRNPNYALVILDVMMPEMSGYETCRKIRERQSLFELPVLMLTARAATTDLVTGFTVGVNDYLLKPFEPEELLARVMTLVKIKTTADQTITAELAFMQAQIKPHFLYNTLNTISSFCDTAPEQAGRLIDELSNYLRHCFDFQRHEVYVPIEDEIGLVKSYVEIEKARFGSALEVDFVLDEVRGKKVLSLSIQPLVENAIRHGIRKKGGSGKVRITLKNTADGVLVSVVDNGVGIPPERLAKVFEPGSSHGVGLWNIDSRLKKLFGQGLTIQSEPSKGTQVMFIIPSEVNQIDPSDDSR